MKWFFQVRLLAFVSMFGFVTGAETNPAGTAQTESAAQFDLGKKYLQGDGVPKDSTEAVKWFRKAAEQNNPFAQYFLGKMYAKGDGVTEDITEAMKWYRKAAEQGEAIAQLALGAGYAIGQGVPKNSAEAVKWYKRAAEQGNAKAQAQLGSIYYFGEAMPKDSIEAVKWFRMAAEQHDAFAQYCLGKMYANGDGVTKDITEAIKWYREAGSAYAAFELGLIYHNGNGIPQDSQEAVKWYRKAAEQNHAGALFNLGVIYLEGIGVLKDEIESLAWYNLAVAAGSESAIKNRDALERQVGRNATLAAQLRSKAIAKEIDASKSAPSTMQQSMTGFESSMPKSSGSGSIVTEQGYILTAAHVVANSQKLTVVTVLGMREAKIVRVDDANDIAIIKVEGGPYVPLVVLSSRGVRIGQSVATVGFPNIGIQGYSPKVTRGDISSLNGIADDPRSWQISVPVQPGNSGGPLLDTNGNLIGVVVAKLGLKAAQVTGDMPQNVNYAVKSAYALALLDPYLEDKTPVKSVSTKNPEFEDMVEKAQRSVVLILAY